MSEFTEQQTVATLESLVDNMTTMTLTETPGNTTIPIITNIHYHSGFPEDDRVTACDWCRDLRCTDPEKCWVEKMSYDCHCCGRYFDTQAELDKHDVNNCWNEYTLSTMDDDRELWYHYEQELAEERMEDFREEMREARMEKAADTEAERRYTHR